MKIIKYLLILFLLLFNSTLNANDNLFNKWLKNFKELALKNDISENTVVMGYPALPLKEFLKNLKK